MPGRKLLTATITAAWLQDSELMGGSPAKTAGEAKARLMSGDGAASWLGTWQALTQGGDPARAVIARDRMDFDMTAAWARAFYVLTPITQAMYLARLHARLVNSKLPVRSAHRSPPFSPLAHHYATGALRSPALLPLLLLAPLTTTPQVRCAPQHYCHC